MLGRWGMMAEQQDRPLWEVMHEAHATAEHQSFFVSQGPRRGYAAELRAIAQEIAKRDPDNAMSALAVEEWLLAEAAEAEREANG
jgi:hypothetical protein